MTIGTAIVASTKVRRTVDIGASQSLRVTLRTVKVGNTHSQIISANWWRVGGAGRTGVVLSGVIGRLSLVDEVRPPIRRARWCGLPGWRARAVEAQRAGEPGPWAAACAVDARIARARCGFRERPVASPPCRGV